MEAGKRTISEIFNGGRILEIPFFQRSYVWDKEQWARLLEDMKAISKNNKPYFLGSVILKQQETSSSLQGDVRTLIDGQQRLTTLNIFFKVLNLMNGRNDFDNVFKLRRDAQIALKHNHNDAHNFNHIVNLLELEEIENSEATFCHIIGAYNYFRENIVAKEYDFFNIMDNIMFVGIDLNRDEDEQQIFDTINSLGVRLTTAELLKNYLFNRNDLTAYDNNWKPVFEKDAETKAFWDRDITAGRMKRENIDLFFYSYLQIKLQDKDLNLKSEDKQRLGRFNSLFENYKEFIIISGIDRKILIKEIKEYALVYKNNLNFDIIGTELTDEYGIDRINTLIFGLENTVLIPFILYVLKNTFADDQKEIFMYLESYIMRRMLSKSVNKNYNNLFSEELILNGIDTLVKFKEYIDKKAETDNAMPSDEDVIKGIHNSKLVNKQTAGILYMIESRIRDRSKHSTALLGLNRYSLEHLMPKKWENNWGTVENEEQRYNRNSTLLTLGNLAIITSSLNSSIRDSSWSLKVNGKGTKKGLKDFATSLETMFDSLELDEWNENSINHRADQLSEKILDIWKL